MCKVHNVGLRYIDICILVAGGYKEMSPILADQQSPNAGGELRGLSQWEQLCTSRDMEPK